MRHDLLIQDSMTVELVIFCAILIFIMKVGEYKYKRLVSTRTHERYNFLGVYA